MTRYGLEPARSADEQEEKRDLAERDSSEPRRRNGQPLSRGKIAPWGTPLPLLGGVMA